MTTRDRVQRRIDASERAPREGWTIHCREPRFEFGEPHDDCALSGCPCPCHVGTPKAKLP